MPKSPGTQGFTLIELMIVVAVVAIIAMIAIPKMADLIRKGNEAGTAGQLGAVRSALHIYFLDNEEFFPADVHVILVPGSKYYNGAVPAVYTVQHARNVTIDMLAAPNPLADIGNWGYVSGGVNGGMFWVQCTHKDMKGKIWSQY